MTNLRIDLKSLSCISYGLYIVTSRLGERLNGQIVNTVVQVSGRPPKIAVSINKENLTHELISESGVFGVSVLDETTPMTLISTFGFRSGRDINKFEKVKHKLGTTKVPLVIEHVVSVLEAKVVDSVNVGTHTVFVGEVLSGEVIASGRALTYDFYKVHLKGKTPKNAPSYIETDPERKETEREEGEKPMNRYVCTVCGYLYDPEQGDPENGIMPGTAFDDLPPSWTCPICGVGKDAFKPEE